MYDPQPFGSHAPQGFVRWALEQTRSLPDWWASRRVAYFIRHFAVRSLAGRPLDVEALGARMRLYPYNNICEKRILFTPQFFDAKELAILEAHIGDRFTFVDIGANVGPYALFVAARAGSTARILAVEPQPEIFDRLTYNIGQNPFGTVKAIACAVADKTGEYTLFLDPSNKGESSVKVVSSSHTGSVRVPAMTLFDLFEAEGISQVDAVKVDVEGAEDLILGPFFRDAPASLHPRLLILGDERGQWQIDLPALLERHRYRLLARTRLNFVYEKTSA